MELKINLHQKLCALEDSLVEMKIVLAGEVEKTRTNWSKSHLIPIYEHKIDFFTQTIAKIKKQLERIP